MNTSEKKWNLSSPCISLRKISGGKSAFPRQPDPQSKFTVSHLLYVFSEKSLLILLLAGVLRKSNPNQPQITAYKLSMLSNMSRPASDASVVPQKHTYFKRDKTTDLNTKVIASNFLSGSAIQKQKVTEVKSSKIVFL